LGVPKLEVPKVRRLSGPKGLVSTKLGKLGAPRIGSPHGFEIPMSLGHPRAGGPKGFRCAFTRLNQ
jgi:hypothetical protein